MSAQVLPSRPDPSAGPSGQRRRQLHRGRRPRLRLHQWVRRDSRWRHPDGISAADERLVRNCRKWVIHSRLLPLQVPSLRRTGRRWQMDLWGFYDSLFVASMFRFTFIKCFSSRLFVLHFMKKVKTFKTKPDVLSKTQVNRDKTQIFGNKIRDKWFTFKSELINREFLNQ